MPRGKSFQPGASGNPKGRPKGAQNKVTIEVREAAEALVDDPARALEQGLAIVFGHRAFCLEDLPLGVRPRLRQLAQEKAVADDELPLTK